MICLHYLQFVLTEEPDLGGKISELKIYMFFLLLIGLAGIAACNCLIVNSGGSCVADYQCLTIYGHVCCVAYCHCDVIIA